MKSIGIGLALTCLALLSACSGKARYIQATDYLVCGNVKPLAIPERHPSRASLKKNDNLLDLIDQYAVKLNTLNARMAEIASEVDDCEAQARALSTQEQQ
ncbi:hypothetical protein BG841_14160 [Marinobacter sp. X15-166B]|nr:hypothetical protein BG841_14160 [Marinobacter sp. X15-166B]